MRSCLLVAACSRLRRLDTSRNELLGMLCADAAHLNAHHQCEFPVDHRTCCPQYRTQQHVTGQWVLHALAAVT